jgi:hypothetical protein
MNAERVARNEAAFRHANEQIRAAATSIGVEPVPFLCECADERCTEIVKLPLAEYEAVRADPRHFLTVPGHETRHDHSRLIEHRETYVVVEKTGDAGELVEQL